MREKGEGWLTDIQGYPGLTYAGFIGVNRYARLTGVNRYAGFYPGLANVVSCRYVELVMQNNIAILKIKY